MFEEKNAFREAAIEAISDMAQHLPLDCELLVVACRPSNKEFDMVLPSPGSDLNNALDALRRNSLSIDGDNAYKRDLCDAIFSALALGAALQRYRQRRTGWVLRASRGAEYRR